MSQPARDHLDWPCQPANPCRVRGGQWWDERVRELRASNPNTYARCAIAHVLATAIRMPAHPY